MGAQAPSPLLVKALHGAAEEEVGLSTNPETSVEMHSATTRPPPTLPQA